MAPRPPSLQGRLIRSVLAMVAAIWLLAAGATWFDARHELDELLDAHLAQSATLLLGQKLSDIDGDDIVSAAQGGPQYAPRVMFQLFHGSRLVLRSDDAPATPIMALPLTLAVFRPLTLNGQPWRAYALRDEARGVTALVAERASARAEILMAVLRSTLWPLLLAMPLLAFATWGAVRSGLAPLRTLNRAVLSRQPQALAPMVVDGITLELEPLLNSMNQLFERIALLLDGERRFTADAAHELRTPIAAIRVQAQVASAEANPEARRRALDATIEGCDRATRLVEQLLALSRLEAQGLAEMRRVDLGALVRQVVAELARKAAGKQQEMSVESEQACPVPGDETLLTVLLRNLVDNALRYSPSGASIVVRLACGGGRFELSVEDSGPGMEEAQLARLGERFFRVAGNRESGSGLGWSVARRIASAHGFELCAGQSERLGGMAVHVSGQLYGT